MVKNRSKDPLCKTNLIIAPPALLDQWRLEIELKTNNTLSCLVYHGKRHRILNISTAVTVFAKAKTDRNEKKSY